MLDLGVGEYLVQRQYRAGTRQREVENPNPRQRARFGIARFVRAVHTTLGVERIPNAVDQLLWSEWFLEEARELPAHQALCRAFL